MLVGPEPGLRFVGTVLAEHGGRRHPALLHRVGDRLEADPAAEEGVRMARAVTGREDAGGRSAAPGVDRDPVVAVDPRIAGETGHRLDPDAHDHEVGRELAPVGKLDGPDRPPAAAAAVAAVAAEAGEGGAEPEVHPAGAVEVRVERREPAGRDPREQARQRFDDGDGGAPRLDRRRGDLEADVASPDHHHPLGVLHRGADPVRVLNGAKVEHAFEVGSRHPVEPPHPAPGREEEPVIAEGAAGIELDPVGSGVDGSQPGPGQQLDGVVGVERLGAEQHPVPIRAPGEIVLRERRALVGRLVLLRHQEDLPVEALPAEAVHGLSARLSAPRHDDSRYPFHAPSHPLRPDPLPVRRPRGRPPPIPRAGPAARLLAPERSRRPPAWDRPARLPKPPQPVRADARKVTVCSRRR